MKKLAAVFVIAVLVPSLVLTWLAARSMRDQEIVVHSQRALLHQGATDAVAGDLNTFLGDVRIFYGRLLGDLITEMGPGELSGNFDAIIRSRWSQAAIGAAVTEEGRWMNPSVTSDDPEVRRFLRDTQPFLLNQAPSEVYVAPDTAGNVVVVQEIKASELAYEAGGPAGKNLSDAGSADKLAAPLRDSVKETESAPKLRQMQEAVPMPAAAAAPMAKAMSAPAPGAAVLLPNDAFGDVAPDKVISQRKVAANSGGGRGNYSAARQESQQVQSALPQVADPVAQSATAGGSAPTVADTPFAAAPSQTAPPFPVEQAMADNNNRSRTVAPLEQFQKDSQFGGLAQAADEVLANNPNRQVWSNLDVNTGPLREIMSSAPEGAISRFVADGLQVLLWRRDPAAPGLIFWVQLNLNELKRDLTSIIREAGQRAGDSEVSLALLDASGQVVAQTKEGFEADWRLPFVATEVGELLPHWEVAAYLIDPRAVARSARAARLTFWMLVPVLLTAIGVGSILIFRDIGREMQLARQKTDFVSNVSHELKTPLTSIRMFSDLLSNRPGMPDGKRIEYSGIISREAARLSRLINTLLDFSRMERGEKRYRMERLDAGALVRETVGNFRPQIETGDFSLDLKDGLNGGQPPAEIEGDRDALSQILLNLLSNAEKYGGDVRGIAVETRRSNGAVEIDVLDRGPGVPRKHAAKIFEKFYRADDSLSSGIEGSGLGLTLARQIARAHGGDVDFSPRPDGGSRFTLRLPLVKDTQ